MSGIDETGMVRLRGAACVLLSGGLDSTACLYWAHAKYQHVRAVGFDYGQPHRDAELVAAGRAARELGVPFETVALADTMHGGLLDSVVPHDPTTPLSRAFVPGRNAIFLAIALGWACGWFPCASEIDLVIGACREDGAQFPDCREEFFAASAKALSLAVGRQIRVCVPYVRMPKAGIIADVAGRFPSGVAALQASWSCYAGKGPCGKCTACVVRAAAFSAAQLDDHAAAPEMFGGDVARDRRLKG